ncbi:hypothetical protein [Nocardia africana]|uniref:Uncharacterized protein n=1 Tax=Nocardia africana TaxID=134964 RepID=A0ABW6NKU8_9NOCA
MAAVSDTVPELLRALDLTGGGWMLPEQMSWPERLRYGRRKER